MHQRNGRRTEDDLVEQLLEKIRGMPLLEDEPQFFYEEACLLRFLKARSWNVRDAEKQLRATVEWRRRFHPLQTICNYCIERPGRHSMRQIGFDKAGRPLIYSNFWQAGVQKITCQEAVDHCVALLENAVRSMPPNHGDTVFVIDCNGINVAACNPKMGYEVCEIFGRYYPERLNKVFCVNHTPLFQWMWNAIKKFIAPETSAKVILVPKKRVYETFQEHFTEEVCQWLVREIDLNAREELRQKMFWLPPKEANEAALAMAAAAAAAAAAKPHKSGKSHKTGTTATPPHQAKENDPIHTHDARGVESYVATFITPLLTQISKDNKQPSEMDFVHGHQPHPNMFHRKHQSLATLLANVNGNGEIGHGEETAEPILGDIVMPEFPDIPVELLSPDGSKVETS